MDEYLKQEYKERIMHKYDKNFFKTLSETCQRSGLINSLFDNVNLSGIENVKEVSDKQLIYISNHVSLADFLIQGVVFGTQNLKIPRFIAGENLNHFPFGYIWKKCGAISIDRNMENMDYWRVYREVLFNSLYNKESLLVYPEGGRSYDGFINSKLKTGVLGQAMKFAKENELFVIPSYINYNKRIEEKFLDKIKKNKLKRDKYLKNAEQNIKNSKENVIKEQYFRASLQEFKASINQMKASFSDKAYFGWDVFSFIYRIFDLEKGGVILSFGKPFSLKDFIDKNGKGKQILVERVIEEWEKLKNKSS